MKKIALSLGLLIFMIFTEGIFAKENLPEKVLNTQKKIYKNKNKLYSAKEEWDEEKIQLKEDFLRLGESLTELRQQTKTLEYKKEIVKKEIEELKLSDAAFKKLENSLEELLFDSLEKLRKLILFYQPYFLKERLDRIQHLKEFVLSKDNSDSEKIRRVIEAYKIEADFARFADVTDVDVEIDGKELSGQLLRIGNLAEFFITPDQGYIAKYNNLTKKYEPVDKRYIEEIVKASEILNGKRIPALCTLPVGSIKLP